MSQVRIDKASELIRSYKKVFESEDGKKVLHDLVNNSGIMNEGFCNHAGKLAYNSGRKSIVLYILSRIDTDPDLFVKILKESYEDRLEEL